MTQVSDDSHTFVRLCDVLHCPSRPETGPRTVTPRMIAFQMITMVLAITVQPTRASDSNDHFEKHVRPLLIERCHKCHSGKDTKGGLRLDSREAVLKGGESGAAINVGKPDASLLLQAVRHEGGLKMPPDGKLASAQVDALAKWIRDGAVWPGATATTTTVAASDSDELAAVIEPMAPNSGSLASSLQLWLRADSLKLADGESVSVWPDQSTHGRDLSATKGIRDGGVGGPGTFVARSNLVGRPAVRFSSGHSRGSLRDPTSSGRGTPNGKAALDRGAIHDYGGANHNDPTGLAASPGNPVDIRGDAALTMMIVMNLNQFEGQHTHTTVFCVGNPAHAGDPGRPLAALIEIDQPQKFSLDFAGGWNHDAVLAPGSYQSHFGKPVIVTIIKRPGPMRETTRIYINGKLQGTRFDSRGSLRDPTPAGKEAIDLNKAGNSQTPAASTLDRGAIHDYPAGSDKVPDIQHRSDIGVFLGKPLSWCGAIQGDVGEVLLYNTALSDADRLGVETYLGEKFGLWIDEEQTIAPKAVYTEAEKSHWAYQPVREIAPPKVRQEDKVRTPVDRFVLAAFESQSLAPPPELDKRALLRRVTFDLTGLPPSPEEVDAFLADMSPQAFETVVNRLLDSPRYGERWGRHWLDLVRYAESTANDANAVTRFAWRYRNYVIDAFNSDLPYDQFLIEQLAGDLLLPDESTAVNTRRAIATGFLMVGPKALAETDKEQSRLDIVDDQIDVTSRAMLGLTVACARCHDHKFDAIRTTDYYALAGIFRSTEPFQNEVRNATMWWEYPVPQAEGVEPLIVMAPKETQPRNLRVHLRGNRFTLGKIVPRGALSIVASASPSPDDDATPIINPHQQSSGRLEFARWVASPTNPLTARVLVNRVWQLHFGRGLVGTPDNFGTRGERPSDPALLDWLATQFVRDGWSVKKLHRVIVLSNTYSRGSLRDPTPDGKTTDNSPNNDKAALDRGAIHDYPRRRRLSAEELRDALLAVSGRLDLLPGSSESGEFLFSKAEDINAQIRPNRVGADDEFYTTFRKRSVYLPIVRNMLPDALTLFDAADPNGVTAIRNETTVASQSLFLLNHPFVREQSRAFAERLLSDAALSDEQRIHQAHRLAYGRTATPTELEETTAFLKSFMQSPSFKNKPEPEQRQAAWQAFCHSLLCSNEFLHVE